MIAGLEPRIRQRSRELLARIEGRTDFDLATEYAVPLAMQVIGGMIGIPVEDWPRFRQWSDIVMKLSYSRSGGEEGERSKRDFTSVTAEMNEYLGEMIASPPAQPGGRSADGADRGRSRWRTPLAAGDSRFLSASACGWPGHDGEPDR